MRYRGWLALGGLLMASALPAPASAITNGVDDEGRTPYVGALVTYDDAGKRLICSGTLIAEDVFLTAAHCLLDEPSDLYVSFDPFVGAPDVGPGVTLHHGTAYAHPAFRDETAAGDTHDVAVVVLDEPIEGAPLAVLAPRRTLGKVDPDAVRLKLVGYGREGRHGKKGSFYGGGSRRRAIGAWDTLQPYKLITDQRGDLGGTCRGDSGGPVLIGRIVTAVVSDGDPDCRINGINYRVDTASAHAFLDPFLR